MEKVVKLLKNTQVPIGKITVMTGCKHHMSFSAVFQEQFGVTPSAFRRHALANTKLSVVVKRRTITRSLHLQASFPILVFHKVSVRPCRLNIFHPYGLY
jgi:hypothetical protein